MAKVMTPWGSYQILLQGKRWWVKRLSLKGRLSDQRHAHRDELWLIWVPRGTWHRIGGRGEFLELALGKPKESDVVRRADDYGRSQRRV